MKKILVIIVVLLYSSPLHSQNELNTLTIILGGTVGEFLVDGGGNFNDFYTNRNLSYCGCFGVGNGETFLIGKYRLFNASGQSKLKNLDATGKADWKQSILSAGFRYHPSGSALYLEALYVMSQVKESIGTENPQVDVLSAGEELKDKGFAFSLGLAPKLLGPLSVNAEVEYSFMLREPHNRYDRRIPNIGGLYYGGGISLYFSN